MKPHLTRRAAYNTITWHTPDNRKEGVFYALCTLPLYAGYSIKAINRPARGKSTHFKLTIVKKGHTYLSTNCKPDLGEAEEIVERCLQKLHTVSFKKRSMWIRRHKPKQTTGYTSTGRIVRAQPQIQWIHFRR